MTIDIRVKRYHFSIGLQLIGFVVCWIPMVMQGCVLSGQEPIRIRHPQTLQRSPSGTATPATAEHFFGIQVVDEETGRGIPLVRLRTTGNIDYWTDSNGWIAMLEPGLTDKQVYFTVDSPGYEMPADGFGFRGTALQVTPGETSTLQLKRTQFAERLYRVTGEGIYRDSALLGHSLPIEFPSDSGQVVGQDSVQMVPHRGGYFWLWGDTTLPHYPLGNFRVTAATSPPLDDQSWSPSRGIPLKYFVDDATGRAKEMLPDSDSGVLWIWGLTTVGDDRGETVIAGHYARHRTMGNITEHGIAVWDEVQERFVKVAKFDLANKWQLPRGQAFHHQEEGIDYVYFAEPFAFTRVQASLRAITDPDQYEALCWSNGAGDYIWQKSEPPTLQREEALLVTEGRIPESKARYQVRDVQSDEPVQMHRASIQWNAFRNRWIMIGCELNTVGQPSLLGEIWYAEAVQITGPWNRAVKVATHPMYSFYNPRHHGCLDEENGRVIYFEGTYTQAFSGNPQATPRYDYNQIMYRLDLARLLLSEVERP